MATRRGRRFAARNAVGRSHDYSIHNNASHIKAHHGAGIRTAGAVIDLDVDAVLTNNIGPKAFATLRGGYVEIHNGVSGTVEQAIARFRAGELESAPLANVEGHCGDASAAGRCSQQAVSVLERSAGA